MAQNAFNRLNSLVNTGLNATGTSIGAGTAAASQQGNYAIQGGNAKAAGIVGGANAISSGLSGAGNAVNGALSAYQAAQAANASGYGNVNSAQNGYLTSIGGNNSRAVDDLSNMGGG